MQEAAWIFGEHINGTWEYKWFQTQLIIEKYVEFIETGNYTTMDDLKNNIRILIQQHHNMNHCDNFIDKILEIVIFRCKDLNFL